MKMLPLTTLAMMLGLGGCSSPNTYLKTALGGDEKALAYYRNGNIDEARKLRPLPEIRRDQQYADEVNRLARTHYGFDHEVEVNQVDLVNRRLVGAVVGVEALRNGADAASSLVEAGRNPRQHFFVRNGASGGGGGGGLTIEREEDLVEIAVQSLLNTQAVQASAGGSPPPRPRSEGSTSVRAKRLLEMVPAERKATTTRDTRREARRARGRRLLE